MKRREFLAHLSLNSVFAVVLIAGSLAVGMIGYKSTEHMTWSDAYLNAAMILGGMGPVKDDLTPAGKFFAATYALYSGLVFVGVVGIMLAPVLHKVLRDFHSTHSQVPAGSGNPSAPATPKTGGLLTDATGRVEASPALSIPVSRRGTDNENA